MNRESAPGPAGPQLHRRLGTGAAIGIGAGSMIGAGVFGAFAPAAAAAGEARWLLLALGLAFLIAFCNATSTAQLAAAIPSAGGVYTYGRERLGVWPGFAAGWSFLIGKTASCAAMCLVFAAQLVPQDGPARRAVAAAAVLTLLAVNLLGITRTAKATLLLLTVTGSGLTVALVSGLIAGPGRAVNGTFAGTLLQAGAIDWYGTAQAAGLLFFAFAGYARIATLGEEVRDPARTIPRAIVGALSGVGALYALVAVALITVIGVPALATSQRPLADLAAAGGWAWTGPAVAIAAATASLGALLALLAGVGRTGFAMARAGDLPAPLATVGRRSGVPWVAEVLVAAVVVVLVLTLDLRGAIGFSSFGVLLYYTVAGAAALCQPPAERRYPRIFAVGSVLLCPIVAFTLPIGSVIGGIVVLAAGVVTRSGVQLLARRADRPGHGSGGRQPGPGDR